MYEYDELRHYKPVREGCNPNTGYAPDDGPELRCGNCGGFHSKDYPDGAAFMRYDGGWGEVVIGGREQIELLIADLQHLLEHTFTRE